MCALRRLRVHNGLASPRRLNDVFNLIAHVNPDFICPYGDVHALTELLS
jgi:hypothetical protein